MAVLINCVLTNCVLINCVLINCVLINWIQLIKLIQLALTPVLVPVPLLVTGTGPPTPGLTCTGLPIAGLIRRFIRLIRRSFLTGGWH